VWFDEVWTSTCGPHVLSIRWKAVLSGLDYLQIVAYRCVEVHYFIRPRRHPTMKTIGFVLIAASLTLMVGGSAFAQTKPVQLALVNPIQIFDERTSIAGVRISLLYGKNASVSGLDWGLVNHTTSGTSQGVELGFVAINDANFVGLRWNFVDVSKGNVEGAQLGFYNSGGYVNGVQIGFINNAASMKGLQLGLINIIQKGGQFPVFPIVNWSF